MAQASAEGVASIQAARNLLNFLADATPRTGYRPNGAKIRELLNSAGTQGHAVQLIKPPRGFRPDQMEIIRLYSEGVAVWRRLIPEFEEQEKILEIKFWIKEKSGETHEPKKSGFKDAVIQILKSRTEKAADAIGQVLIDSGFLVRDPIASVLCSTDRQYSGHALYVRYPESPIKDAIGLGKVYDRLVPYIAEIVAREHKLRSEAQVDKGFVTIFVTGDKKFVPSIYDAMPQFRMVLPRTPAALMLLAGFSSSKTYRACKKMQHQYKKDFFTPKHPQRIWDQEGHCIFMHYKKGAKGRVVDESYMLAVRRMAEKTMKQYHINSSIDVHPGTGTIVVSFFKTSAATWRRDKKGGLMARTAFVHAPETAEEDSTIPRS